MNINGDWLSQWEMAIFNPLQNPHPLTEPIAKKFVTGDYGCDPMAVPNLVHIRPRGASGRIGEVKYN